MIAHDTHGIAPIRKGSKLDAGSKVYAGPKVEPGPKPGEDGYTLAGIRSPTVQRPSWPSAAPLAKNGPPMLHSKRNARRLQRMRGGSCEWSSGMKRIAYAMSGCMRCVVGSDLGCEAQVTGKTPGSNLSWRAGGLVRMVQFSISPGRVRWGWTWDGSFWRDPGSP